VTPDRARPPQRFDDADAIDDAECAGGPQIVGDGLGDARGQPGKLAIVADVFEVQHGDRGLLGRNRRFDHWRGRHRSWYRDLDRRDKAVAATGYGLNVGRLGRVVPQCLAKLRYSLSEGVVRDRNVRPESGEQLVLGDQRRLASNEVEKKVDDFRRQRHDLAAAKEAVRTGVDSKGPETVRRNHRHCGGLNALSIAPLFTLQLPAYPNTPASAS
jgi:hypothetical protein